MIAGQTAIRPCKCFSPFQDEAYGKGMRVHNAGKLEKDRQEFSCTVCQPGRRTQVMRSHALQHDRQKHG